MPVYIYECRECKHTIEELQKFEDAAPDPCPRCQASKSMERRIGPSNFQLVGSGWAKDGYA